MNLNRIKISLLLSVCLLMASCGFLDKDLDDTVTDEQILRDPTLMGGLLINIYNYIPRNDNSFNCIDGAMLDCATDDGIDSSPSSDIHNMNNGAWGPSKVIDDQWGRLYYGVRACALFFSYIDRSNVPDTEVLDNDGMPSEDSNLKSRYKAEAKVLRALIYSELIKRFGDVPWYDKVLGSDDADLYKARDSREFVMGKIMEDLNFAIEIFKETNRTKELYRVTWWTAQALKSRVGLFEGTYRKYHGLGDYEKYLNDCVSASNEIMTASGGYSLYQSGSQSYRNLFKSENAIDAEIILARDYNNDLSLVHKVQAFENSPTLGRPGLSKKLVNYYLMKNGNRFTDQPNYATMEFKDEIVNRDPRLAQTIRTSNINMNVTMTGYHLLKYANDNMSYTGDSSNDLPLFRLAEVYLNYAEAKAELGTLTQTDIDNTINKLRTRAGVTGKLNMNAANLSPDPYMCAPETGYVNITGDNKGVILEIRRERAIELVMEGFRYYDLMRWKEGQCMAQSFKGFYLPATAINKAYDIDGDGTNDVCFYTTSSQPNVGSVTYVKLASDGSGTSLSEGNYGNLLCYSWIDRTWNENRDYLYPVPRQEITLSDGVVTQNPGWNE